MKLLQKNSPSFVLAAVVLLLMLWPTLSMAADGVLPAVTVTDNPDGSKTYSATLQILFLMTMLSLLPAALIMMTSFTRIIIVLAVLRHAIGLAQSPSNQILIGLALFLTLFVMAPVFEKVNEMAVQPYLADEMSLQDAVVAGSGPFREFMLNQTRDNDLEVFAKISGTEYIASPEEIPFTLLLPSFVTSELKTAFQIGFMIFLPFLIIDLVVASVLMAMGMMMLSPMMISLPFKLMLFVLVDGWVLIMGTLASSFYM
ncbi:MAG: flagellar type III secretion system pore protein FliP [Gammaproteobacteria bacterium]|nr:flagellar type III secretion system pore protein FliP [Gammaproteobacteria bacterium]MCF6229488.1 flagellar type III secretion system pore protein FliP [Gammaproteobacteria bacterium]